MKLTEFLKKYSTIENKFIDDFYSFYDDGQNEYDFTINLQLIADWINVRKDILKRLLLSNFIENRDFIQKKESGQKGRGINNTIHILLTYNCSKLLCMISKSEKADLIRNYYIDLEKLIITYKDNIINDLNRQLGIQTQNNNIVNNNKKEGLIYVLKVDDETYKIGNSKDIKNRMKQYNVGRLDELPIVFVYKSSDIIETEKCIKKNLDSYRIKKHKNNEVFKVDNEFIKDTINYCSKINTLKVKENKKLYNAKDNKNWLIIIDNKNSDINQLFKKVKKYTRKTDIKPKHNSKKNNSKKIIKKNSKKNTKR